jgi:hypothetical protein
MLRIKLEISEYEMVVSRGNMVFLVVGKSFAGNDSDKVHHHHAQHERANDLGRMRNSEASGLMQERPTMNRIHCFVYSGEQTRCATIESYSPTFIKHIPAG